MDLLQENFKKQDQIYSHMKSVVSHKQDVEKRLRKLVASRRYNDYLAEISKHHSICVMDKEVALFLEKIPYGGIIIDVGGCWGWHWRHLSKTRSDVKVVILDFVKENLCHAANILGDLIDKQIFLVHGDATKLDFPGGVFDGYWSVQTLQHIPEFKTAVEESYRVLKTNGVFHNYSLNNQWFFKVLYTCLGRRYHSSGYIDENFYLERFSKDQKKIIENIFKKKSNTRYSEILFNPSLNYPGKIGALGKFDSLLSNSFCGGAIARQQSCLIKK